MRFTPSNQARDGESKGALLLRLQHVSVCNVHKVGPDRVSCHSLAANPHKGAGETADIGNAITQIGILGNSKVLVFTVVKVACREIRSST